MKLLKENWAMILLIITWVGGSIAFYIDKQVKSGIDETRMFKDGNERYEVINKVMNEPNAKQQQRAYFQDSIFKAKAISAFDEWDKSKKYQESIILLNADQIYQIKNSVKKMDSAYLKFHQNHEQ